MCLAAGLLGFLNLVNREEFQNIITKGSIDLIALASYLSKLLDTFCNETKYVQFFDQCWRQRII